MEVYSQFIDATQILYTRIFQAPFFFLDLWSINHMWSGFVVFLIAAALHIKRPLLTVLACLIGYEIFEILLTYFTLPVFIPEIIKDQFTDIFIGFAGSCIGFVLITNYNQLICRYSRLIDRAFVFFVSMSAAFLWLVFSPGSIAVKNNMVVLLNLTIFFLWLSQAYLTIVVFRKHGLLLSIKPWLIFIPAFMGCTVLNFNLLTLSNPAMDMIPGTFISWLISIKVKIIIFPFLPLFLLSAYKAFEKLVISGVVAFKTGQVEHKTNIITSELIND